MFLERRYVFAITDVTRELKELISNDVEQQEIVGFNCTSEANALDLRDLFTISRPNVELEVHAFLTERCRILDKIKEEFLFLLFLWISMSSYFIIKKHLIFVFDLKFVLNF